LDIAAVTESERSAPPTFPGIARFSLFPDARLSSSSLFRDKRPLLAQRDTAASGTATNVNLSTAASPGGTQKSYVIPALEIVGLDVLLNLFDRAYYGCCDYDTDLSSIKRNLHRGWNEDRDEFTVNQLGHPYQGSMYHGFARASGLNYWQGLALHLRREPVLGNSRGNHTAVQKRSDQYRNRRQFPRRGAVPHFEPLARTRERIPFLA
jgi:hypothetical protein